MLADVFECAIAAIAIKDICGRWELSWRAIGLPLAPAYLAVLRIPHHVARDQQIQMAVIVVIEKAGGAAPAASLPPGFGGDVCKSAIAIVVVEGVFSFVRDVQIGITIVVVIADRYTHAVISVTCVRQPGFLRDVGETPIRILPVEAIPIFGILPVEGLGWVHRIVEPAAIDQKNVEQSV